MLFLRRAHSLFIKNIKKKKNKKNNDVNIELGKTNRLKALCIMQMKKNEINKNHESMKKKAEEAVSKAIKENADEALIELKYCPNRMLDY